MNMMSIRSKNVINQGCPYYMQNLINGDFLREILIKDEFLWERFIWDDFHRTKFILDDFSI